MDQDTGDDDWLDVKVARHWRAAVDIVGIELVSAAGGGLPSFDAGAHIDVLTPGGHLRPYSLCSAPVDRHRYIIAVLHERHGRGGSEALHKQVRVGDRLRIRAPRNAFALVDCAVDTLLLAGGIGVTPLLAMAHALWARGAPFALHYSARNAERAAFAEDLRRLPFANRVHCHWTESAGRLNLAAVLRRATPSAEVYVCGPQGFIRSAAAAHCAAGRTAGRLHVEAFGDVSEPRLMGRSGFRAGMALTPAVEDEWHRSCRPG